MSNIRSYRGFLAWRNGAILAISACFSAPACTSLSNQLAPPEEISLNSAMKQLGPAFAALDEGLKGQRLGVVACEITVAFNISASGSETSSLSAGGAAGAIPQASLAVSSATANVGYQAVSQGIRGNTITIKFQHTSCLPQNALAGNVKALEEINEKLDNLGQLHSVN